MKENMKNMIISISGTPVSGKGTTVKEMKKLLVQNGYKKENIYVISTGNEFRNYFNLLIDFINSISFSLSVFSLICSSLTYSFCI